MKISIETKEMMEYLYDLPGQFEYVLKMDFSKLAKYKKEYNNIVVSGLGGSAIGGDILRTYAGRQAKIPVFVNRDYDIPEFVNEDTLFLAVSYSGNTEETLSAYKQACEKGADVIVISSGGKLSQLAEKAEKAVLKIPGGLVPRAATAYLFTPLVLSLEELGLLSDAKEDLEETVQVLKELRKKLHQDIDIEDNEARNCARAIKGHIPIIWGSSSCSEVAAMRWKAQINENAKSPAYFNVFPELNHNEIVGFEVPENLLMNLIIIMLKDEGDNPRIKKRMHITKQVIKDRVADIIEVESRGASFLARFYSLAYIGDYASVYLALEYGIDPTPVKIIDYLKEELAKNK